MRLLYLCISLALASFAVTPGCAPAPKPKSDYVLAAEKRALALSAWARERNAIYLDELDFQSFTTFEMQLATDFPNKNLVLEAHILDAWHNNGKGYILAEAYQLEIDNVLLECSFETLASICNSGDCMYENIACLVTPTKIQLKPAYLGEEWSESDSCGVISDGFARLLSAELIETLDVEGLSASK